MRAAALVAVAAFAAAPGAQAGLFDDDEARRAILEIRERLDEQSRARQADRQADQQRATQQVEQLRRSIFDLNSLLEQQRGDNARLRGQIEELSRTVAELQRKQSDIAQGVEERMRRIEPQKVTHEGREFNVDPDEKRQYDEALAVFRRGDFERAQTGFSNLLRRWPQSGYRDSSLFWQGNAQYAAKQYKEAITTFRTVVTNSPDSPHAPESLLAIANCQAELKDPKAARKTIEDLVKAYPRSEAAQAGRDRLVSLR